MLDDRLHHLLQKMLSEQDVLRIVTDFMHLNDLDQFSGTSIYKDSTYKLHVFKQQSGSTYAGDSQ